MLNNILLYKPAPVLPPVVSKILLFDGINDFLDSTPTFNLWERTQPFSLFCRFKSTNSGTRIIFTTNSSTSSRRAILFLTGNNVIYQLTDQGGRANRLEAPIIPNQWNNVTVVSDGIGNNPIRFIYVNGVSYYNASGGLGLIESSITAANSTIARFGRNHSPFTSYFAGSISWFSYLNYYQSFDEIQQDHIQGFQSLRSGAWLVPPIRLLYSTDGLSQISSLNPTVPVSSVPNFTFFGKTNPMSLELDFVDL